MSELDLAPPFFHMHLYGGLRLIYSITDSTYFLGFSRQPDGTLFSPIKGVETGEPLELLKDYGGLRWFAYTHVEDGRLLGLPISEQFYIGARSPDGGELARQQQYYWQGIGEAHRQSDDIVGATRADRIQTQIQKSVSRFERLSEAYGLARIAFEVSGKELGFSWDRYSDHIGAEFLALIECLYALRDALNDYYWGLKKGYEEKFSTKKLRSVVAQRDSSAAKLIHGAMYDVNDKRLIYRMSLLRAVSQHCLGNVNPIVGDHQKTICETGRLGSLTLVTFPLYDNVELMEQIESGQRDPLKFEFAREEWLRFCKKEKHLDALHFAMCCFVELLKIGRAMAAEISLKPMFPVLTEANITGEIRYTDKEGNEHFFKKVDSIKKQGR